MLERDLWPSLTPDPWMPDKPRNFGPVIGIGLAVLIFGGFTLLGGCASKDDRVESSLPETRIMWNENTNQPSVFDPATGRYVDLEPGVSVILTDAEDGDEIEFEFETPDEADRVQLEQWMARIDALDAAQEADALDAIVVEAGALEASTTGKPVRLFTP